jgi:hypothetical protein
MRTNLLSENDLGENRKEVIHGSSAAGRSDCLLLPLSSPVSCKSFESCAGQAYFRDGPNLQKVEVDASRCGSAWSYPRLIGFVHQTLWNVAHQQRAVQLQSCGLGIPFVAYQANKLGSRCCKCVAQASANGT